MQLLCFLLETIKNYTELQTQLEHEIQQPGQPMCYSHFILTLRTRFVRRHFRDLEAFCYNWPHMQVVSACMILTGASS